MFYSVQREKIGNLLVLLAERVKGLTLTKALKLLYIIDEEAVKDTGVPVTWLDYEVWKYGPVSREMYFDLKNTTSDLINSFILIENKVKKNKNTDYQLVHPARRFNDDEFSEYELGLISRIINDFGDWADDKLVEYLHQEHFLWSQQVKEYGLAERFKSKGTSEVKIPLERHRENDPEKSISYMAAKRTKKILDAYQ